MAQAGTFDQRITISTVTSLGHNSYGEDIPGTPTEQTFWARIGFLMGRELEILQQRWAEATIVIEMRRQPGVTIPAKSTATWNGRALDILDVQGPGTRMPVWRLIAKDYEA